jgi:uncharacterized membrane protein
MSNCTIKKKEKEINEILNQNDEQMNRNQTQIQMTHNDPNMKVIIILHFIICFATFIV